MSGLSLKSAALWAAAGTLFAAAAGLTATMKSLKLYLTKLPIHAVDASGERVPVRTLPDAFPGWKRLGEDKVVSKEEVEELGTENYLTRIYIETDPPEGRAPLQVSLHAAYYTGTIDTVPHVPERCNVAQGMSIVGAPTIVDVPLDRSRLVRDPDVDEARHGVIYTARSAVTQRRFRLPRGVENLRMNVTKFVTAGGEATHYAGYFFIANGGVVPTADEVRLMSFKLEDDYSYYLKVQLGCGQAESPEAFAAIAGRFLDELWPDLARRVPDWVEVKEGTYPGVVKEAPAAKDQG